MTRTTLDGRQIGLRQRKGKRAILAEVAGHRDGLAVSFDDGLGNKHAKSHSALVQATALVALIETFKYEGNVLGGNALAFVVYRDGGLAAATMLCQIPGKAHAELSTGGRELHGVIANVIQDLMDGVSVRQDEHKQRYLIYPRKAN